MCSCRSWSAPRYAAVREWVPRLRLAMLKPVPPLLRVVVANTVVPSSNSTEPPGVPVPVPLRATNTPNATELS